MFFIKNFFEYFLITKLLSSDIEIILFITKYIPPMHKSNNVFKRSFTKYQIEIVEFLIKFSPLAG